jgi:hypothetical protein
MGVTAYLEVYGAASFDPGASTSRVLFAAKGLLPPAWFLFFAPDDFVKLRSARDGSDYTLLRCARAKGIERARHRLAALRPHDVAQLGAFVDAVERGSTPRLLGKLFGDKSVLVLNSHRFEASRAQLTGCAKWFDDVAVNGPTTKLIMRAEELFDPLDGLELVENRIEVADVDALCGHPGDGVTWIPIAEQAPPQPKPTADAAAALASVWARPDDLDVRVKCGIALAKLGDPRGDFIVLDCNEARSARDDRRHEKLLDSSRDHLSKPFSAAVMFHHGFPLEVEWDGDPSLAGHAAWSTVKSLRYRGPAAQLCVPALARVERLHASPELVREIAAHGKPVGFRSICMNTDRDADAWQALESRDVFPDLVEIHVVDPIATWLPQAAQALIRARPELHVNTGSPSLPMRPLAPMSAEEHAQRIARWTTPPPGPFLAGPRYDNGFR